MKAKGFTLIEMMVTIAVLAILLMIAVPSFRSIIINMRMSAELDSLVGDMKFARSEAIKRGLSVSICPSAAPITSTPICDIGSPMNWSSGWVVYVGAAAPGPTTQILRISTGVTHGDTLIGGAAPGPIFSGIGYNSFIGTITLHDSADTASLRRCLVFAAGTFTAQTGASC